MAQVSITLVIDALSHPAPFEAMGGPPPLVQTLLSVDRRTDLAFEPPVILCMEEDMARARGAFVVSGDGDGCVIACTPAGTADLRRRLVMAARQLWVAPGQAIPAQVVPHGGPGGATIPLLPASLKGVWVPEPAAWQALCDSEPST